MLARLSAESWNSRTGTTQAQPALYRHLVGVVGNWSDFDRVHRRRIPGAPHPSQASDPLTYFYPLISQWIVGQGGQEVHAYNLRTNATKYSTARNINQENSFAHLQQVECYSG